MTSSDDPNQPDPYDQSADYWRENPDGSRSVNYPDWKSEGSQQAGSQGGSPGGAGGQPPPQANPYDSSYTQQGQPTQPYGQQPYGQQPPPYGQQPYGQQPGGYSQPYGTGPQAPPPGWTGYQPAPPAHGSATTAMVLGLIGLVGIMFCGGITLVLSPFAWVIGGRAVKEIDANPGVYGGRDQAQGGRIMGIIGTVLLALAVVVIGLIVVLALASSSSYDDSSSFLVPVPGLLG